MLSSLVGGHGLRFCPHASYGWRGGNGAIGQFNAEGRLRQFQMLEALASGLAYPADLLCYVAARWLNDISFARRDGQHAAARTADQNGRMGLLRWPGNRAQPRYRVVCAGEIDRFAAPKLLDDGQPLGKTQIGRASCR